MTQALLCYHSILARRLWILCIHGPAIDSSRTLHAGPSAAKRTLQRAGMAKSDPVRAATSARLVMIGAEGLVATLRQARSQPLPAFPCPVIVLTNVVSRRDILAAMGSWLLS